MGRDDLVTATLRDWRQSRFAWRDHNCVLSVTAYAAELCGRDPSAAYRGRFEDEHASLAYLAERGGTVALLDADLGACGFVRTTEPERGDIVAVRWGGNPVVAGLCLGLRCAMLLERGAIELSRHHIEVVAAWRLD